MFCFGLGRPRLKQRKHATFAHQHLRSMSQNSRKSVLLWLASVSSPENTPTTPRGKKRKRCPLAEHLPTAMNSLLTRTPSPSKRRKIRQADFDDDSVENTPWPRLPLRSTRDDVSQQSSSSTPSSVVSPRSRSPTKQMAEMLFAPQPILFKQFVPRAPGELPAELNTILQTIERRFSRGIGVVSDAHRVR